MKAAVSTDIGKIEICEIVTPIPEYGEALIKVSYCGLCGSDINGFKYGDPFAAFPHVFGHEASGVIAEINGRSDDFKVGDRIVYEISKNCGKCKPCLENRREYCTNFKIIGGHLQGAFAEYICVPLHLLHHIPDSIPMNIAAVCEPYTVAARSCDKLDVSPSDMVLVMGAGNIALCAVACAKERGAKVIVAARNESRLKRALLFEPDVIINTELGDLKNQLDEATNALGCTAIIEATGAKDVVEASISLAGRGTRIAMVGMCKEAVSLSPTEVITKELKIFGSQNSYSEQYEWVLQKMSENKLHTNKFITHIFDFTQAQEAMEYAIENAGICGKVLLRFSDAPI